jgi:hypothetical protein
MIYNYSDYIQQIEITTVYKKYDILQTISIYNNKRKITTDSEYWPYFIIQILTDQPMRYNQHESNSVQSCEQIDAVIDYIHIFNNA